MHQVSIHAILIYLPCWRYFNVKLSIESPLLSMTRCLLILSCIEFYDRACNNHLYLFSNSKDFFMSLCFLMTPRIKWSSRYKLNQLRSTRGDLTGIKRRVFFEAIRSCRFFPGHPCRYYLLLFLWSWRHKKHKLSISHQMAAKAEPKPCAFRKTSFKFNFLYVHHRSHFQCVLLFLSILSFKVWHNCISHFLSPACDY